MSVDKDQAKDLLNVTVRSIVSNLSGTGVVFYRFHPNPKVPSVFNGSIEFPIDISLDELNKQRTCKEVYDLVKRRILVPLKATVNALEKL